MVVTTVSWSSIYVAPPCNYNYYTNYTLVICPLGDSIVTSLSGPVGVDGKSLENNPSNATKDDKMIKLILECRGNGDIAALLGCLSAGS